MNLVIQILQWRGVLIVIQVSIGVLMILALFTWLTGKEERSLRFAVSGFLLSLVALQTLYLSQFSALTTTLLQLSFLLILLSYSRWYLSDWLYLPQKSDWSVKDFKIVPLELY